MNTKFKKVSFTLILAIVVHFSYAQDMGVSFSLFFPKNGYLSAPISPFSIRGLGIDLNNYIALESGASLYRMTGMNITGVPFESKSPMVGPFFNVMVPAEIVFQYGTKKWKIKLKGGGFAFYNFGTKLNVGNIDKAIIEFYDYEVANSDFNFKNNIGYGYQFGTEYIFYINRSTGISLGGIYFIGNSKLDLNGTITSGSTINGIENTTVTYPDAKLDYTGFELTIGILFSR